MARLDLTLLDCSFFFDTLFHLVPSLRCMFILHTFIFLLLFPSFPFFLYGRLPFLCLLPRWHWGNEGNWERHVLHHDMQDDPPFLKVQYTDDFLNRLDHWKLVATHRSWDDWAIQRCPARNWVWKSRWTVQKCWWHWGSHWASVLSSIFSKTDMLYVSATKKCDTVDALATLWPAFETVKHPIFLFKLDDTVTILYSYNRLYASASSAFSSHDMNFDLCRCSIGCLVFPGRHNM